MAGTTEVETEALKQSADALVGLRADTDKVDDEPTREAGDAARALNKGSAGASWDTADALIMAGDRFNESTAHLKRLLAQISDNIHQTHKGYSDAEKEELAKYDHNGNQSLADDFG